MGISYFAGVDFAIIMSTDGESMINDYIRVRMSLSSEAEQCLCDYGHFHVVADIIRNFVLPIISNS